MAERWDVEERWPELFAQLDPTQRRSVVQSLAASWHEGWEPNREDVTDLVDVARGTITFEEYERRSVAKAHRRAGAHESVAG